jgi:FtsZ-binding cell division protein ZapB
MSLGKFKKEVVSLRKMKADFDNQLVVMNADLSKLRQENESLRKENSNAQNMIAGLQKENKTLKGNLDLVSAMANNSLSEAVKKNNKMTVSARKAKKIQLAFDIPQRSLSGLEFKVTSPNDKVFTSTDGSISHRLVLNDGNPVASLDPQSGYFEISQRVVMEYAPKKTRMEKGIYKVDVFSQGTLIGRMQVKLK